MPTQEEEYYSWKTATFGEEYDIWHDGLRHEAVDTLQGEARDHALGMLYTGVELQDSDAASALAAMKDVSAVPALRAQLAQSSGASQVRVALAIHALSPSESHAKSLIAVLEDDDAASTDWGSRLDAAMGLREFADEISEEALRKAVAHDGHYLVRYHASESLLKRWKIVPESISSHPDIFKLISASRDGTVSPEDERARFGEAVVRLEGLRKQKKG